MNKQKSKKEVVVEVAPKPPPRRPRPLPRAPVQAVNTGRGRLHEESRYLRSILDPIGSGAGSKIPDTVTCPSMPFTGSQKFQLTAGATGVCAAVFATGVPNASIQQAVATSTPAALSWTNPWLASPYAAALASNAQAIRVVSALFTAQVQGSSNNNQGRMIACFQPTLGILRTQVASIPPPNSATTENSTYAISKNVASAGNTVECRFIPLDPASLSYFGPGSYTVPAGTTPGYLIIVCDGLASGVIVEFQAVENLEIIPLNSSASIATATPSLSDPLEIAVVMNKLSAAPAIAVEQSKQAQLGVTEILKPGGSTQTYSNGKEPTFMERAMGWAKTGAKIIEVATPVFKSLLAAL